MRLTVYEFESQPGIALRFYLARPNSGAPKGLHIEVVDEASWRQELELARAGFAGVLKKEFELAGMKTDEVSAPAQSDHLRKWTRYIRENQAAYVTFTPRGVGISVLSDDKKYVTQVRRRFMLLGQTLAGMQVWDVRRAIRATRQIEGLNAIPLHLRASPEMSEVASFALLFEPDVSSLTLAQAPRSDKESPDFLNWSRIITPRQLLSLAQARCEVKIEQKSEEPR